MRLALGVEHPIVKEQAGVGSYQRDGTEMLVTGGEEVDHDGALGRRVVTWIAETIDRRQQLGCIDGHRLALIRIGPYRSQRVLLEVTGALRIYTAAMGESSPHFHGHLVPRYAGMPKGAIGWAVFDLERAAKAGEIMPDVAEVERVSRAFASALEQTPPPAP